jgi:short-subunit dehydrogenase
MDQLNTNMFGSINMTKALPPYICEWKTGTIVFISSFFSWYDQPCGGAYAISKHGLAGENSLHTKERM